MGFPADHWGVAMTKTAVHFGAGAIGRGFLGELYWRSGWQVVFVDISSALVKAINERGGYTIEIVGPGARTVTVSQCRAVDARDACAVAREVALAGLVSTAVGVQALESVAPVLAEGISLRAEMAPNSTLDVLICENLMHASQYLRSLLERFVRPAAKSYLADRVGLVETVVSRMIPAPGAIGSVQEDPLRVAAEDYNVLPADKLAFRGEIPAIWGLLPVDNFIAYQERKLYAHNCGHALAAYFGALKGHVFIWQVMEDKALLHRVEQGLWEVGKALCQRHGFSHEEHAAHIEQLLRRFANAKLGDTIARVGRDPLRKLGPSERLVGAARLAMEHGSRPEVLAQGIAAAMRFPFAIAVEQASPKDPSAAELADRIRKSGPEGVLKDVCRIEEGSELWKLVMDAYRGMSVGDLQRVSG